MPVPVLYSNRLLALLDLIMGTRLNGFAGFRWFVVVSPYRKGQGIEEHERQHVEDMKELGYFTFMFLYLSDETWRAFLELRGEIAERGETVLPLQEHKRNLRASGEWDELENK